jgi:HD-GYP domain-containing protein (c-di-GMP phosphodiesterase class II)
MDGSGYPRGLHKEDMPLPSRIMAVADIFEALTAADRPYKKAKKLSEAVKIMAKMRDDNHIDADLFDLFLRSGTYKTYAQRYLSPEQIDEVDIFTYLQEEESTTDLA